MKREEQGSTMREELIAKMDKFKGVFDQARDALKAGQEFRFPPMASNMCEGLRNQWYKYKALYEQLYAGEWGEPNRDLFDSYATIERVDGRRMTRKEMLNTPPAVLVLKHTGLGPRNDAELIKDISQFDARQQRDQTLHNAPSQDYDIPELAKTKPVGWSFQEEKDSDDTKNQ